ncbi:hypothetical protein [Sinomonas sp. ASV322]|uniref:hypothetical protein n=1 Tax=Sinomonas sp. ASV322 TaxID=3041920 RepID=UPI0027DC91B3|nr:hypothetical protein [Sinomonas sp. ASV322]MDQ4501242.1 hypothetical protein [Sinomonas sp. ASV322]
MSEAAASPRSFAGHNRVSTQALTSLARAAAAEQFGVRPSEVRATWADDAGLLALSVVSPIAVPELGAIGSAADVAAAGGTVWERASAAKGAILRRVAGLSGTHLSRVDIRIAGVRPAPERRVRVQ